MQKKKKMVDAFTMLKSVQDERRAWQSSTKTIRNYQGDNEILVGYQYPFISKIELQNTFGYISQRSYWHKWIIYYHSC